MRKLTSALAIIAMIGSSAAIAQPRHDNSHGRAEQGRHQDWMKHGGHVPPGHHREVINDYNRYHLRKPPSGYRWERIDNRYVLVGITSGIIQELLSQ